MAVDKKEQFRELRRISGWSPAETARQLGLSCAHVSNIENPDRGTQPGDRLLNDFRRLVGDASGVTYPVQPERVLTPDSPEMAEATSQLRELEASNPEGFRAARSVIYSLTNSAPKRAAARVARRVAARVRRAVPAPPPSPKADEHTSKK